MGYTDTDKLTVNTIRVLAVSCCAVAVTPPNPTIVAALFLYPATQLV
jgi:hypothetical protein